MRDLALCPPTWPPAGRRALQALAPALLVLGSLGSLGGCATPEAAPSVAQAFDRPAERHLLLGLRAYDEAQYAEAERLLGLALQGKLANARDTATAHKTLAFIYCTSGRPDECAKAFRAARGADPGFTLNKAEAGHPVWGPVYAAATSAP